MAVFQIAIIVKNLTIGGAEKQAVLLAKALAEDVKVNFIIFNGAKVHKRYLNRLEAECNIHVVKLKGNICKRFISFLQFCWTNEIEIIFSYLTAANCLSAIVGRLAGVKRIYAGLRNSELPHFKLIVDRFICNCLATGAIVNCYSGRDNFIHKGFKREKVLVIPNCIENIHPFQKKSIKDTFEIITVGRFVTQKDYETVVHVAAELKKRGLNFRMRLVGYGELENQIRKWVTEYGVDDRVVINIHPNNIIELLEQADIYLSTSIFEGTSNSIMEAMSANLPIVATDVGDNNRLVVHNRNGFLCVVKDYIGITNRIDVLVKNNELREKMGRESKNILIEDYSIEDFKNQYLTLCRFKI